MMCRFTQNIQSGSSVCFHHFFLTCAFGIRVVVIVGDRVPVAY